jgi:hypothetical protein
LSGALHDLFRGYAHVMAISGHGSAVPGSEAANEIAAIAELGRGGQAGWSRERIDTAHALVQLRLSGASDLVAGTGTLIAAAKEGVYSPWSTGRSAFESAGIAFWLTEPGVGVRDRVARSLTDRLASIRGAQRFGRQVETDVDFEQRFETIVKLAEGLGFEVGGEKLLRYVGSPYPKKSEFAEAVLGPELSGAYSLFSGWTHGEAWTLTDSLRRGPDKSDPTGEGRVLRAPGLTLYHYGYIAALVGRAFVNAVDRAIGYFGWESVAWRECAVRSFRAVGKVPTAD